MRRIKVPASVIITVVGEVEHLIDADVVLAVELELNDNQITTLSPNLLGDPVQVGLRFHLEEPEE
jgi:hypothetical protein